MSLASQLVDDGTGIYPYQLMAARNSDRIMNQKEEDDAERRPTAKDLLRNKKGAQAKQAKPGRHRDPDSSSLIDRIKGRRRDR